MNLEEIKKFLWKFKIIVSLFLGCPVIFNRVKLGEDSFTKNPNFYEQKFLSVPQTNVVHPDQFFLQEFISLNKKGASWQDAIYLNNDYFSNFFKLTPDRFSIVERFYFAWSTFSYADDLFKTYIGCLDRICNLDIQSKKYAYNIPKVDKKKIKTILDEHMSKDTSSCLIRDIIEVFNKPQRLDENIYAHLQENISHFFMDVLCLDLALIKRLVKYRNHLSHGRFEEKERLLIPFVYMLEIILLYFWFVFLGVDKESIGKRFCKNQHYAPRINAIQEKIKIFHQAS